MILLALSSLFTQDKLQTFCIILYHIASCGIISHYIVSYCVVQFSMVWYGIVSYHIVSYHIVSLEATHARHPMETMDKQLTHLPTITPKAAV